MIKLALTMGDPAGIGPEVVLKAFGKEKYPEDLLLFVIGDLSVLEKTKQALGLDVEFASISSPEQVSSKGKIYVMDMGLIKGDSHSWGIANPEYGHASMEYVKRAVELALEGEIDGLVTAPINKMAVKQAGYEFPGHTEFLAHLTNTQFYTMMLVGGNLRVVLVTRHLPLKEVSKKLNEELILRTIELTEDAGQMLGFGKPRIAVCGLNPHAGDGGVLGDEEEKFIKPAIVKAQEEGINAVGPLPPDTVFYKAYNGGFDLVVAMYHDQGLIPLKMLYFDEGVNVTLGLPIIRTSVDHGTAYDIAGKGIASEKSMVKAIEVAYSLAKGKRQ